MLRADIKSNHMSMFAATTGQTERSTLDTLDAGPAVNTQASPSHNCVEIQSAALYIAKLIAGDSESDTTSLVDKLIIAITQRYQEHWFPNQPLRASGFRCLTFPCNEMDPLVAKVCQELGINTTTARNAFPSSEELMIWVDPNSVTSRLSDRYGLFNTIYGAPVLQQRAVSVPNGTRAGSLSPPLKRSPPGSPLTSLSARANSFTPMHNSPPSVDNFRARMNSNQFPQATSWKPPMAMSPPPGITLNSRFSIMA